MGSTTLRQRLGYVMGAFWFIGTLHLKYSEKGVAAYADCFNQDDILLALTTVAARAWGESFHAKRVAG